jgi:Kef-type K+ transport system membrane component KefB/Trk K+ transport system NAD-binding subunit
MFLSGLEIDFESISSGSYRNNNSSILKSPVALGTIVFISTIILSLIFSYFIKNMGLEINIFLMALILSTTSLGIVVPILKETGIVSSRLGQSILFSALIADFVTMLLITALVTFMTPGKSNSILLVILLFMAFYILYKFIRYITHLKLFDGLIAEASQIHVRGVFALILIFIVLSHHIGVEIILGAFLAGALISMITHRGSILHDKLEAIGYGFFVPIFFVMVGVKFDFPAIFKSEISFLTLGLFLLGAYLVKFLPALFLKINHSWREVFGAGFLLSSRLSLIIAAAAIGLKIGVIDVATNSAIILIAIITCTTSPVIFKKLYSESPENYKEICILGASEPAFLLANKIHELGYKVKIVDDFKRNPGKVLKKEIEWVKVNWDERETLSMLHPEKADNVVVASPDEDLNEKLTNALFHNYNIKNITALISKPEIAAKLKEEGITTVSPQLSTFLMLKNLIIHPRAFELLLEDENIYVKDIELNNNEYHNKRLEEIKFPGNCLVISIIRDNEKIFPNAKRKIKIGDKLLLVGDRKSVEKSLLLLSKS